MDVNGEQLSNRLAAGEIVTLDRAEWETLGTGFSVVEILSECVIFYPGAFDAGNPRKGGEFALIDEKKWDETPEDEERQGNRE